MAEEQHRSLKMFSVVDVWRCFHKEPLTDLSASHQQAAQKVKSDTELDAV
jgi:hypothetical protein